MSVSPVWVVGAGGLLGASVWRELGERAWRPARALSWGDSARLEQEFRDAVRDFGLHVQSRPARSWAVAWCAGAGVVGTSAAALEAETRTFERSLALIALDPNLSALPGALSLASSAGGVYAGSRVSPLTETTEPVPISPYGHAKLAQERILAAWVDQQPRVRALTARFSNLYGPGQQLGKPQGLISHTSRCVIYGAPVQIYVSLDTIRDYLFADDAARELVAGLRRVELSNDARLVTKIYASEREISIAGLLSVFRQIAHRRLRIVAGLHAATSLQPRRLQFRSQVWQRPVRQVELIDGVNRVYHHQLALFARGLLPPPPHLASRRS